MHAEAGPYSPGMDHRVFFGVALAFDPPLEALITALGIGLMLWLIQRLWPSPQKLTSRGVEQMILEYLKTEVSPIRLEVAQFASEKVDQTEDPVIQTYLGSVLENVIAFHSIYPAASELELESNLDIVISEFKLKRIELRIVRLAMGLDWPGGNGSGGSRRSFLMAA